MRLVPFKINLFSNKYYKFGIRTTQILDLAAVSYPLYSKEFKYTVIQS